MGLLPEAAQSTGIAADIGGQHLEGDLPVQLGIRSPIDFAHSSGTESSGDLVMGNRLSNHGECLQNMINTMSK